MGRALTLRYPDLTHGRLRARQISLTVVLVSVLLAGACGASPEVSGRAGAPSTTSTPNGVAVRPARGATPEEASALRAGFPAGVAESFEYFADARELQNRVDATVVGSFNSYELNPKSDDTNLYVPGYAGSAGVLRVYFELIESLGGRAAEVANAPGRAGEGLIAVDLPYFMPERHQAEHFEQLDALEGVRFLLFLVDGTIGSEVTGAYQLWEDPFGAFAEGVDGSTVRVLHDTELILRDATERGAKEHPEASVPAEPEGPVEPPPPDIPTPLEGRPFEAVLDELQQDDEGEVAAHGGAGDGA